MKKMCDSEIMTSVLLGMDYTTDARPLYMHPTKTWPVRPFKSIRGLVVHQSLGSSQLEDIAEYHRGPNHISQDGLPGPAYHFFIEDDGHIRLCANLTAKTYSQGTKELPGDENEPYLSVCVGGDFHGYDHDGKDQPSPEQLTSLLELWIVLSRSFEWNARDALKKHSDFGKTNCPGNAISSLIRILKYGV